MDMSADLIEEVSKTMLPEGADKSSYITIFDKLVEEDIAADELWAKIKNRAEYDALRLGMRAKMIDAMGGFPEKTDLNPRTVDKVVRDGYSIEKVIFESMPGVYVTANLFIPASASPASKCPVIVMSCGHAGEGKDCDTYIRACVIAAKSGLAALMFDPYEQGERRKSSKVIGLCRAHDVLGIKSSLLGWSMSALRCWDGIRAIDYVETRPEIDSKKIGYMGNSGGGTMTALMESVEPRIRAAAPSCYLTSLREVCDHMGPQDAEQNIFGQLSFGLNHAGYVAIPDIPVGISCCFGDMFDYYGTRSTFSVSDKLNKQLGTPGKVALLDVPGPHGWKESTETASVEWIRAWLAEDNKTFVPDMPKYRALDLGFDLSKVDLGLADNERGVTEKRDAFTLPGATDINDVLLDKFNSFEKSRAELSKKQKADYAVLLADIRKKAAVTAVVIGKGKKDGIAFERIAFQYNNGLVLPAVLLMPGNAASADPVIMVAQHGGRAEMSKRAGEYLAAGRAVLIADITATGEIGVPKHVFYGNEDNREEGMSVMLYLMGESMTGRRATDIIKLGEYLMGRFDRKAQINAEGNVAIAAAHAFAAADELFSSVTTVNPPMSWTDFLKTDGTVEYAYTNIVNGAAKYYDWTELV